MKVLALSLGQAQQMYEKVMQLSEGLERDTALSELMDVVKREFGVPLLQNQEWEQRHPAIIAMYRKISMSRSSF
ncbi:hypothetical protein LLE49_25890 [Alicyclobacillus tolerans]|uniref:hypothetical protein n=1 Tax=Alicyclobacillus tolerans TaxID=90970 RepID=UPI001F2AC46E|nr:hypothetical protein [Alicyclobacillus tolerans]MCF8568161.1 hypothetical protein [Alicyclobacillus tolerans]